MLISVVVLNWNGAPDTIRCLQSLARLSRAAAVVVVDNGSTDDSVRTLERAFLERFGLTPATTEPASGVMVRHYLDVEGQSSIPCLTLIRSPYNLGYAGGNNLGISVARTLGCQYAWILNNDTMVHPNSLEKMLEVAESDVCIAAVGCTLIESQDRHLIQCVGGGTFNRLTTRNCYASRGKKVSDIADRAPRIEYLCGASMLLRLGALLEVGDFSTDFFLFYEELDLAKKLTARNNCQAVATEALVYHEGGVASGAHRAVLCQSPLTAYHAARSLIVYLRRWEPHLVPWALAVRLMLALAALPTSRAASAAMVRGLWAGVRATSSR